MPAAPTRGQDTRTAVSSAARETSISKALGAIRPEHLHIALEALGLQHLRSMVPSLPSQQAQAEPLTPEDLPNPATAADAAVPGGAAAAMGRQNAAQQMSQQMLTQLNQNLPTNQMAQILARQQMAQQDPLAQLKSFIAASQGFSPSLLANPPSAQVGGVPVGIPLNPIR